MYYYKVHGPCLLSYYSGQRLARLQLTARAQLVSSWPLPRGLTVSAAPVPSCLAVCPRPAFVAVSRTRFASRARPLEELLVAGRHVVLLDHPLQLRVDDVDQLVGVVQFLPARRPVGVRRWRVRRVDRQRRQPGRRAHVTARRHFRFRCVSHQADVAQFVEDLRRLFLAACRQLVGRENTLFPQLHQEALFRRAHLRAKHLVQHLVVCRAGGAVASRLSVAPPIIHYERLVALGPLSAAAR